jgi:hypothetical protein
LKFSFFSAPYQLFFNYILSMQGWISLFRLARFHGIVTSFPVFFIPVSCSLCVRTPAKKEICVR